MELVKRYETFDDYRKEISNYIILLNSQKELPSSNELQAIAKHIIFMKIFINNTGKSHYKNSLLFDILSTLHALTQNSIRQFHYVFRSFIENYVRSILELRDNDETGVNELFRKLKEKYGKTEITKSIIDFIIGEYGRSCLFVHSNIKANFNLQLYYSDILSNDDFNKVKLRTEINKILLTLKKMTLLLIHSHPNQVENSFYRKKQLLKFLIGEQSFNALIKQLTAKN